MSDGVIHTAFIHDFSKFQENCEIDRQVIAALGSVLAGSDRPLIITSGTGMASPAPGRLVTEEDVAASGPAAIPRVASEEAAASVAASGIRVSVVRLPQVHDRVKQGLVTYLIGLTREKGVSAFVGDGLNRWSAVHRLDAAHLYRLALERGRPEAVITASPTRAYRLERSLTSGRGLNVPVVAKSPEEAAAHFGWLALFVGLDLPASSAQTQERLGWHPTGPGLIADPEQMRYFEARRASGGASALLVLSCVNPRINQRC